MIALSMDRLMRLVDSPRPIAADDLLRLIRNPHRRGPDQLAVSLLAPNVVVAFLASRWFWIGPLQLELRLVRLAEHCLDVVFDERYLRKRRGADELNRHGRRLAGLESVAQHVFLAIGRAAIVG